MDSRGFIIVFEHGVPLPGKVLKGSHSDTVFNVYVLADIPRELFLGGRGVECLFVSCLDVRFVKIGKFTFDLLL